MYIKAVFKRGDNFSEKAYPFIFNGDDAAVGDILEVPDGLNMKKIKVTEINVLESQVDTVNFVIKAATRFIEPIQAEEVK